MYWSLLSVILDITLYLDDALFLLISDSFDNSDTCLGSKSIISTNLKSRSTQFEAFTHIAPGILLILVMKFKRDRLHQLSATKSRYIRVCLTINPSLSTQSYLCSTITTRLSQIRLLYLLYLLFYSWKNRE